MKKFLHFILLIATNFGCQPKANLVAIEDPMSKFSPDRNDDLRGAATVQDLSSYLFLSLKGDITFNQLSRFIPDSSNIVEIYSITKTDARDANLKSNADTVLHQLQRGWIKTRSQASELKANWSDATFTKLLIEDIENQKIPSKKIMLECKSGTTTLRASAKCMQIGDRWFIGEDIKLGV
jgi:hypothetical protein